MLVQKQDMERAARVLQLVLDLKMIELLTCVFRVFYCINEEYVHKPFNP